VNDDIFESSEFYKRRYANFSTIIIVPSFILFICVMLFLYYGIKETTLKSSGRIESNETIVTIHSSNSTAILENYLSEGKEVKENDALLIYENSVEKIHLVSKKNELERLKNQKKDLIIAKESIIIDELISKIEKPRYNDIIEQYFVKRDIIANEVFQSEQDILSTNENIKSIRSSIEVEIKNINTRIGEYEKLKQAIEKEQTSLSSDHSLYWLYKNYQSQMQSDHDDEMKASIIVEIENSIYQLETSRASLSIQESGVGPMRVDDDSLDIRLDSLKKEYQMLLSTEETTLNNEIFDLETQIEIQKELEKQSVLFSPIDGILQLSDGVEGMSSIPEGAIIGKIYPKITNNSIINIVSYVNSKEIADLREGNLVIFKIFRNYSAPFEGEGVIQMISTSPEVTEQGNYYRVISRLHGNDIGDVRHGLEGEITFKIGEKTFFNYYKDRILNRFSYD